MIQALGLKYMTRVTMKFIELAATLLLGLGTFFGLNNEETFN
jgi:hypothetical protein